MRTSITIPEPFAIKVKESLPHRGYMTINGYILDLIRKDLYENNSDHPRPVLREDKGSA
jgi:hypothetical protein